MLNIRIDSLLSYLRHQQKGNPARSKSSLPPLENLHSNQDEPVSVTRSAPWRLVFLFSCTLLFAAVCQLFFTQIAHMRHASTLTSGKDAVLTYTTRSSLESVRKWVIDLVVHRLIPLWYTTLAHTARVSPTPYLLNIPISIPCPTQPSDRNSPLFPFSRLASKHQFSSPFPFHLPRACPSPSSPTD